MRAWWVVPASLALLAAAYGADRLLVAAIRHQGTYLSDGWADELLLLADRAPKAVVLAWLGLLALAVVRARASSWVGWALVAIGAFGGIAISVAFPMQLGLLFPLARDTFLPSQFVVWAGGGLLVIGLAPVTSGFRTNRGGLPAWSRLVIGAIAAAAVLVLDARITAASLDAALDGAAIGALAAWELAARWLVLLTLGAMLWLLANGDRSRIVGGVEVLGGLGIFVGLATVHLLARPHVGIIPFSAEDVPVVGYALRWLAGGIALLGLLELVLPAHPRSARRSSEPIMTPHPRSLTG